MWFTVTSTWKLSCHVSHEEGDRKSRAATFWFTGSVSCLVADRQTDRQAGHKQDALPGALGGPRDIHISTNPRPQACIRRQHYEELHLPRPQKNMPAGLFSRWCVHTRMHKKKRMTDAEFMSRKGRVHDNTAPYPLPLSYRFIQLTSGWRIWISAVKLSFIPNEIN